MTSQPFKSPGEILRDRARVLAQRPPAAIPGSSMTVIEFGLADERYAIEMRAATEVCNLDQLTPVPCTPPFVAGIVNVRGRMVAVIDLKKFFELPEKGIADLHRVILVQHDDVELGLLADFVVGVRMLEQNTLQSPLATHAGVRRDFVRGIGPDGLVVLDTARLLTDPKLVVNDEPTS